MWEKIKPKKIVQYLLQRNDIKFEYYIFTAHVFLNIAFIVLHSTGKLAARFAVQTAIALIL